MVHLKSSPWKPSFSGSMLNFKRVHVRVSGLRDQATKQESRNIIAAKMPTGRDTEGISLRWKLIINSCGFSYP